MKLSRRRIQDFQANIFSWWRAHRRDLPWRHTRNPYKILVSEIMLQQTQVRRVIPKYLEFIGRYPTASALANASVADVLKIWKGLGYNRRALYLKRAAEAGKFPKSEKELMNLPGVGIYTARAILVFAYKEDVALIDTNIRQIITHFFFDDKRQKESVIQKIALQLVPVGKSWEWHQALMDYGASELKSLGHSVKGLVKKQKRYIGSNRYYRGKMLDILRERSVSERILLRNYPAAIIHSLIKDGLIVRTNGTLSLPT